MLSFYLTGFIASFAISLLVNRSKFIKETLNFAQNTKIDVMVFASMSWLGVLVQILIIGSEWYIHCNVSEKIKDNKIVKFIAGR